MIQTSVKIHGVKPTRHNPDIEYINEIKQNLFLFDSIGVAEIERLLHLFAYTNNRNALDEVLGLQYNNLIFDTHKGNSYETYSTPNGQIDFRQRPGMTISMDSEDIWDHLGHYNELMMFIRDPTQPFEMKLEAGARVSSILWNNAQGNLDEYYPLITPKINPRISAPKEEVFKIMIDKFPIPHSDTPIEHLLEFREHSDNSGRLLAFKNLINDMSRGGYSRNEINQKLEHLIDVYTRVLNKEKIKTSTGVLEAGVTAAIDHSLLTGKGALKIVKSVANFFSSEKPGPGYEISYLIKAHQMFRPE